MCYWFRGRSPRDNEVGGFFENAEKFFDCDPFDKRIQAVQKMKEKKGIGELRQLEYLKH